MPVEEEILMNAIGTVAPAKEIIDVIDRVRGLDPGLERVLDVTAIAEMIEMNTSGTEMIHIGPKEEDLTTGEEEMKEMTTRDETGDVRRIRKNSIKIAF